MNARRRFEKGFAAVAAIFLVVVLAALGGYMLAFSNTQQITSAQDIQGSRGYWAARAGLEWGIGGIVADPAVPASCPASPTTLSSTFDGGFTVTVVCVRSDYLEAGATRYLFRLTATATAGAAGSAGFIERSVSASLER